jgi:hypothetical protein
MMTPGFSASVSIYPSFRHYATTFIAVAASPQLALPALPPRLPNGGGNGGGGHCLPTIGPCGPDCMRTVTPCVGQPYRVPCCSPGFQCQSGSCVCPPGQINSNGTCCPVGKVGIGGICYPTPLVCSPCVYEVSTQQCCFQPSPGLETCHDQTCCGPGCKPSGGSL